MKLTKFKHRCHSVTPRTFPLCNAGVQWESDKCSWLEVTYRHYKLIAARVPRLDIHNTISTFYYLPFPARLTSFTTFPFYSMVSQVVLSVYQIFLHFFSISKKTQYLHSPNNAIYHGNWKTYKYFLSFWVSFKDIKRHLEIAIKKDFFEDSFKK